MKELIAEVYTVTPDLARQWLSMSAGNRNLVRGKVEKYKADIKAGRWVITNQGIGFDEHGRLIDGHHRLTAIVEAGLPVKSLVVMGLSVEAMPKIDVGEKRQPGDILKMVYGVAGGRDVAALAKIFVMVRDQVASTGLSIEPSDLNAIYLANPQSFAFALKNYRQHKQHSAYYGTLGYFYSAAPKSIEDLAERISTKVGIEKDSPELALLNYMEARTFRGEKNPTVDLIKKTSTALYHKIHGSPVKLLRDNDSALAWLHKQRTKDL